MRSSVQKTAELIEMPLVCGLTWAQGIVLDGGPDPPWDTLQSPCENS